MAADTARPEDNMSELESLQLRANTITDESLESTRRMIGLCEESQNAGAKTMAMLEEQGEQLERVEKGLDKINVDVAEANKHLTGMEKFCGLCICPWNRRKKVKDVEETWETTKDGVTVRKQPGPGGRDSGDASSGPYIQRITNDAREDEMEENMQAVGSVLSNLKNMATDMGQEIEKQNKDLDRIQVKTTNTDVKIHSANDRTAKLLKK